MKLNGNGSGTLPILYFEDQDAWITWLEKHHAVSSGVWLRLAKKTSGEKSVSYADALEAALCFGWIDGQKKSEGEKTWLQKFTRRSKKSIWSKVNRNSAQALIDRGLIRPAGMDQIERAKQDGRWERAYDSPGTATVPADFHAALEANPAAVECFRSLNSRNRYALFFRIQTAKTAATRVKRIQQFVQMLERGEKPYP